MRAAINAKRKYWGEEPLSATDFLKMMREKRAIVELDNKLASRSVNEGFSGGEKKRNEIFQMAMLQPRLSILDETDSGLDIDALRIVSQGVNQLKSDKMQRSSSRTTNGCSITSHPISCTYFTKDAL